MGGYHEKYCDYHCKNLMSRLQRIDNYKTEGKVMVDLRDSTVLVNNVKEYRVITENS